MSEEGAPRGRSGQAKYDALARRYDARWSFYVTHSIAETLTRFSPRDDETVLDVGCGTGQLLESLANRNRTLRLFGADPSPEMLAVARERLAGSATLVEGSAESLPFSDASFDWVVSTSVFHYIRQPEAALAEWRRVLRPGGSVVVTDWCRDYLTISLFDVEQRLTSATHVKAYTSGELTALLRHAGFADVTVERYRISWFWGLMTARSG